MWSIYDALILGIPENLTVDHYLTGDLRCLVRAENTGISTRVKNYQQKDLLNKDLCGRPLREVAALAKSWDFEEASLGMAAINACYNDYASLLKLGAKISSPDAGGVYDVFELYKEKIVGRKVAMIGHFDYAMQWMKEVCDLSVFEREPAEGDYPDSAEDFLLPEQEFVFITGMTFTNKTLPHLLNLSKNAEIILVGPTVPATPILFDFGVSCVSSLCVMDPEASIKHVQNGACRDIYQSGSKVVLAKKPMERVHRF